MASDYGYRAIDHQTSLIKQKLTRPPLQRTLEATDDAQDVLRALRTITSLIEGFTVRLLFRL